MLSERKQTARFSRLWCFLPNTFINPFSGFNPQNKVNHRNAKNSSENQKRWVTLQTGLLKKAGDRKCFFHLIRIGVIIILKYITKFIMKLLLLGKWVYYHILQNFYLFFLSFFFFLLFRSKTYISYKIKVLLHYPV